MILLARVEEHSGKMRLKARRRVNFQSKLERKKVKTKDTAVGKEAKGAWIKDI